MSTEKSRTGKTSDREYVNDLTYHTDVTNVNSSTVPSITDGDGKRRLTREAKEQILRFAIQMFAYHVHHWQILRALRLHFNLTRLEAVNMLKKAREIVSRRMNKTRDEMRLQAFAFYEQVIMSQNSTIREKLDAQQCIDRMFGLYEPVNHRLDVKHAIAFRGAMIHGNVEAIEHRLKEYERLYDVTESRRIVYEQSRKLESEGQEVRSEENKDD